MPDATERLVNLAMFLAESRDPVTAEQVRAEVDGYPAGQDNAAFIRMFERDKDDLRLMGLCIESDNEGRYELDISATFAGELKLSAEEVATIRVVGSALLDDPGFPFAEDLRFALAKTATAVDKPDAPAVTRIADERPFEQGLAVAALERAATARKRVRFDYVNSRGEQKAHEVETYGLFVRDGRWYLVGRDVARDETRTYTIARLDNLVVDAARPRTPDYERPADFDIVRFIRLPFQYGPQPFEATLRFGPPSAWRAAGLIGGVGTTHSTDDGTILWQVTARDSRRLLRWVVENGPGVSIVSPSELAEELDRGLSAVAATHAAPGGDG